MHAKRQTIYFFVPFAAHWNLSTQALLFCYDSKWWRTAATVFSNNNEK